MLNKNVTPLLISAVVLLSSLPSQAFAQTPSRQALTGNGQILSHTQAKPELDLGEAFAEVRARTKADTLREADINRLAKKWSYPQTTAKPQSGYTTKQKVLVIFIVAGVVVLAVVLGAKTGKGGHSFCDIDPADPD